MGNQSFGGVSQRYLLNHLIVITSNTPNNSEISDETYIKKYNIMMENHPIDEKELDACPYVLIRHALSEMNYHLVSHMQLSPNFIQSAFGDKYRAPRLHRIGI